jgi:GTP 3',8-cyclase
MNTVDYLRISLTDRCNFRCQYCMPVGEAIAYQPHPELLTNEEILRLVRDVFGPVGFRNFRLTGGEPLIRSGIVELVGAISSLETTQDLALTTNAWLLADLAAPLYDAGLRRINISLDSLNPATFAKIIGRSRRTGTPVSSIDTWQRVWQGIQAAHEVGFDPLKLNVVVIPGVNDREVLDLAALSIDRHWHVRFIEFMPIGNDALFLERGWVDSAAIRSQIRDRWGLEESTVRGNGPADIFRIPGALGTLGFISQMSECFCDRCNRVRLSADGWLRPCLLNESGQLDLKTGLRSGVSDRELQAMVRNLLIEKEAINFKERESGSASSYSRTMSQIGG